jgi:hypothetical protein
MIMQSDHTILLHKQLVQVKCELKELELTQYLFWLIFKNYSKAEKSLSCYFCQINSAQDLEMGPVALDRSFPKLSNGVKFTRFGLANLKWLNFKVEAVLQLFGKV